MSTVATPAPSAHPAKRRWTRDEYAKMGQAGLFRGQRVELIEGEIMVLSPQGPTHAASTDLAHDTLKLSLGGGVWVRMQLPVDFGILSEPEPDVSVVNGKREDYASAHPTTALLLVEVSDSTLLYDRNHKGSLYARVGIADYWIVNLVDHQLEVRRNPIADATKPFGFDYADMTILNDPDEVSPLCMPNVRISVADLIS